MHERKPITLILLDVTLKSGWTHIGSAYYIYLENTITLENTAQIKIHLLVFDWIWSHESCLHDSDFIYLSPAEGQTLI